MGSVSFSPKSGAALVGVLSAVGSSSGSAAKVTFCRLSRRRDWKSARLSCIMSCCVARRSGDGSHEENRRQRVNGEKKRADEGRRADGRAAAVSIGCLVLSWSEASSKPCDTQHART